MAGLSLLCLLESSVGAITACFLMLCQAGEQWALIPIFLGEGSWKQMAEQKCFVGWLGPPHGHSFIGSRCGKLRGLPETRGRPRK